MSERQHTYAVIGAGVFGAFTALHLLQAGHRVILLDQYGPANRRASSGGESRIIRCGYGPDQLYTRMAQRSLALWERLFEGFQPELLRRIGVLWITTPQDVYAQQSRETLRSAGVHFRELSNADLAREYPQIHVEPGAVAILEPESGALMARQAVHEVIKQFVASGGVYRHGAVEQPHGQAQLASVRMRDGDLIQADAFVFACGPWLPKLFPEVLGNMIFVTRQEVLFFGIQASETHFSPPELPVWIDFSRAQGVYGFPDLDGRGFKLAIDDHGPPIDPDSTDRVVAPEKIAEARAYLAERFPQLAAAPVIDSRVCQYENTSNGDFLIDQHPEFDNVWLVGGGSGHGFKHGPAIGEYAAARVLGLATPAAEPRFSLETKQTEQRRSVY